MATTSRRVDVQIAKFCGPTTFACESVCGYQWNLAGSARLAALNGNEQGQLLILSSSQPRVPCLVAQSIR